MAASSAETAHLRFTLAVHRALTGSGGDSCFSPYSVASALGLVTRAARGATAAEPAALLAGAAEDVPEQADLLHAAAQLHGTGAGEEPVLAVSNTLWMRQDVSIRSGFTEELARWPAGRVATAPFAEDPETARGTINTDVARTTHDLIPELLPAGTVRSDTVASLVNALYLRVAWASPFRPGSTAEKEFHAPAGTRRVPMMRQTERFRYAERAGWQMMVLPAMGGVEAVVLLPAGSLAEQESTLDENLVAELLSATKEQRVHLSLPRLSLDVRSALKPALRTLGVHTMFTQNADFGALTGDHRLLVSEFLHQAVLRMDESGLEGAAATAAIIQLMSMPVGKPVTVEVNRPFLLLVRHAVTGAVYFLARVVEP